jgi:hypothetical protein
MLFAVDLHKNFIDVESIAVSSVLSFQSAGMYGIEPNAPKAYRFAGDGDTSVCQESPAGEPLSGEIR